MIFLLPIAKECNTPNYLFISSNANLSWRFSKIDTSTQCNSTYISWISLKWIISMMTTGCRVVGYSIPFISGKIIVQSEAQFSVLEDFGIYTLLPIREANVICFTHVCQ